MNWADLPDWSEGMNHPLIQRLHDEFHYPEVTLETHEEFINQEGFSVLFFAGDPTRYRETADVAVILPEIVAITEGNLHPGVVARDAEIELQKHYGFRRWPALVLLRDGGYLGAICKVRDWSDYIAEIGELMIAETTRPPGFKIAVVAE
jgi:hydrogenase-1 operon protein HyaE